MAHTCNPSTLEGRGRWISKFEASLVYRVSSKTARAKQRNRLVSKKPNPKQNKTNPKNHTRVGEMAQQLRTLTVLLGHKFNS